MNTHKLLHKSLVILFWLGIWAAAAYYIAKPLLLPSPISVFARIFELLLYPEFWQITTLSLLRITIGILFATALGVILAVITSYSKFMNSLLEPIQTITKVTPVASFILLVLIWVDRNYVPAIISALMVLPVIWNNVAAGIKHIDPALMEMARVYHLSAVTKVKRILVPSVLPYFLSAVRTAVGIGWKAGIAAEVLTVPVYSIGKMIADSKMYMETVDLFAWTTVVVLISLFIEKIIIAAIIRSDSHHRNEGCHG